MKKRLALSVLAAAIAAPALSGEAVFGITGMKGKVGGDGYETDPYFSDGGYAYVIPEDNDMTGYGAFVGYIWDVGKEGGFLLGTKLKYESLGAVEAEERRLYSRVVNGQREYLVTTEDVSETIQSGSAMFVGEQNLGKYVKFFFAVGLGATDGDFGVSEEIGFNFRMGPSPVWLSLAYHGYAWVRESESYYDDDYLTSSYRSVAASLNFRF